ncbi:MAG TPA: DUF58 domain-containing protein [Candidatus Ruania gallistercoris]|uniref:DUF58 domain-containing protein n=1 Tax=Candidatus Ruania gallistercoris TaxID=2838746 RepID=A0A9D2EIK8_9MICO|nr:DUF58 domain-containing protein [Candidatus Ruania gallistercoris]
MRPTARGLGLLLAGAVLAFLATSMHSATLGSLAALTLAAPVVALVWVAVHRIGWPRVDLHRTVQPSRPVSGEWAQVQLRSVPARLPAWTTLRERLRGEVERGGGNSTGYRLRPKRRGLLQLGPAVVLRTDPLQLMRWRHVSGSSTEVLVWPATTDVADLVRLWPQRHPRPSESGQPERSLDDLTLRDYRRGDDLRRIHWRSSARHGELLVRQDDPMVDTSLGLMLDLGPAEASPARATEWTVSACASLAVALLADGQEIQLALAPAREAVPVTEVPTALDAFARVGTGAPPLPETVGYGALVAVLRAPAPGLLGELAALTGSRQCLALLVDADVEASTDLAAAGWLVHSCTSGEEIAAMWSRTLEAWSHQ